MVDFVLSVNVYGLGTEINKVNKKICYRIIFKSQEHSIKTIKIKNILLANTICVSY